MCDYSLTHVKSRPAQVGDKLRTVNFGTGTRGFGPADEPVASMAVCLLPGTELAFDAPISTYNVCNGAEDKTAYNTAIFRQTNREHPHVHHDMLEFPNGQSVLLTFLREDQTATVLQLPAAPKTEAEAEEQRRVEYAG